MLKDTIVKDIAEFPTRAYHYAGGDTLTIENCRQLQIKPRSDGNGYSHRVFTKKAGKHRGTCYFIPQGWIAISYPVANGVDPFKF